MTIELRKVPLLFLLRLGVAFAISIATSVIFWWLTSRIHLLQIQDREMLTQNYGDHVTPKAIDRLCITIDIAIVCMGGGSGLLFPMLKSLMHHRQNPLHFHLMVDSRSQPALTKLFDTWKLPDVTYTCYNVVDWVPEIAWIPNTHYSGIYGLIKLLFPEILPLSLKQVIVLDSDLIFLCDVAELWNMFSHFTNDNLIGLVENESNWYRDNTCTRWPALGRGYNMGVMLLDLDKLRKNDWKRLWYDAVIDNIHVLKETTLGEQDVINSLIYNHPNVVYNISCKYNIQMSQESIAKKCYGEDKNNIKIFHWNSPLKYTIKIRDSDFFQNIYQSYINLDFTLLRVKLHECP